MSLILDALRRADSERERGAVPGLHAQPVPVASPESPAAERPRLWLWIAAAAGVGLLAALAWFVGGRDALRQAATPFDAAQPQIASAPAAPAVPHAAETRSATAATPSAPMAQASVVAAPAPVPVVAPPPRPAIAEPQPIAEPAPWTAPASARNVPNAETQVAAAAGASAARAVPEPAATAATEAAITTREQLPENIRSQLPPLVVGGSIYSASPTDRSLIIDGRLFREKDRLTADLSLEQIRPKSAVLRFRGYRFEVTF